jgi:hypothetical protein
LHQFQRRRGGHPHQSAWFTEDLGDFRAWLVQYRDATDVPKREAILIV